jgi:hypothetical protein
MQKLTKGFVLLLLTTLLTSCGADLFNRIEGNRNVVSEERKLNADFSRVKVSSGIDLYIKQGNKTKLTVEADENLHDYIKTEVRGDQLRIYVDGNIWRAKSRKVYVTVKEIEELKATSGSDVISQSVIQANRLSVSTSSGADMRIEVEADDIISSSSSGSDLSISGTSETHSTSASSGSSIRAYDLESKEVTAKVSSGANIRVYAKESIDAKASSGGDIRYKGSPKNIYKKTSSGGGVSGR